MLPIICHYFPRVPIYVDINRFILTITSECTDRLGKSSGDPSIAISDVLILHPFSDYGVMRPHISAEFAAAISELRIMYAEYAARAAEEMERIKQERRERAAEESELSSEEEIHRRPRRQAPNTIVHESESEDDIIPVRAAQAQHDTEEEESTEEEEEEEEEPQQPLPPNK